MEAIATTIVDDPEVTIGYNVSEVSTGIESDSAITPAGIVSVAFPQVTETKKVDVHKKSYSYPITPQQDTSYIEITSSRERNQIAADPLGLGLQSLVLRLKKLVQGNGPQLEVWLLIYQNRKVLKRMQCIRKVLAAQILPN